ncbi:MAG: hypothetical protein K2J02_00325 [Malacoplasma sp.]|nr:hypothetical protein [Malacoplasma sp.]MDE6893805.1 hypothetical protein [Malacoplasma sp.]MDE7075217.1 hypothetical protein [Malacoplasma sp.]MDE7088175.1 hypothetical protein [Malacoplasma sp.]
MSNIWNKDERIMELVVKHYNVELKASNTYSYLATVAKSLGYDNVASYLVNMASDKLTAHLPRLSGYLMQVDYILKISQLSIPESFGFLTTIQDVLNAAVKTEQKVRESVAQVTEISLSAKDFETFERMQWFVRDSIEDLEEISDLATYASSPNVNMINIESIALSRMNKEKKEY